MSRLPSLLIVDDEADACRNLSDIFSDLGYQVDMAHDGREALERVGASHYDLAVLDLMMPDMDGVELYRKIKQSSPETVAILATAFPNHPRADQAIKAGLWKILSKPVDLSQLASSLDEALHRPLMLLVDDDHDLCANLSDIFRDRGYRVAIAHDLHSATERLRRQEFGIILVDVRLPDGDGRELLKSIRGLPSETRTILITGQRASDIGVLSEDIRTDAVCHKPLDVEELFKLIGRSTRG